MTKKARKRKASAPASAAAGAHAAATELFAAALRHHQAGRLADAESGYRSAIERDPAHADAWHLLGAAALQRGAAAEAAERVERALALAPDTAAYHASLADALGRMGRAGEAESHYRRALAITPDVFQAHYNLGNLLRQQGMKDEALAHYRRAAELAPDFADAANNLGALLAEAGRIEDALAVYRSAGERHPRHAGIHNNLGNVLKLARRLEEAAAAYRRVTELAPGVAEGWRNLAATLKDLGEVAEAEKHGRNALALAPADAVVLDTLGNILMAAARANEALACYDRALALRPDFAAAHGNRAMALLLTGDFERGWHDYEWRWQAETFTSVRRDFARPRWEGSPFAGRTILLHTEQGMGDAIQFARYVPIVAARGGTVVLACQRELKRLFHGLEGAAQVVSYDDVADFDCHLPLMSLPGIFATRLETIPAAIPYLKADAGLARRWGERIDRAPGLKVGIVWHGNPLQRVNRARSCPPALIGRLAAIPGVSAFSLQKEPGEGGIPAGLTDLGRDFADFADTAAAMSRLDVVVSVCTSVAHLAGALGRPIFVMLGFAADWRWLQGREDSPWYPSARLFRQSALDDWAGVIERVASALAQRTGTPGR